MKSLHRHIEITTSDHLRTFPPQAESQSDVAGGKEREWERARVPARWFYSQLDCVYLWLCSKKSKQWSLKEEKKEVENASSLSFLIQSVVVSPNCCCRCLREKSFIFIVSYKRRHLHKSQTVLLRIKWLQFILRIEVSVGQQLLYISLCLFLFSFFCSRRRRHHRRCCCAAFHLNCWHFITPIIDNFTQCFVHSLIER